MATPGELRLVGFQELQVGLGDGQWARIGSVVTTASPPGPLIDVASGTVMQWQITNIIATAPYNVLVSGGPMTNTLSASVQPAQTLKLVSL